MAAPLAIAVKVLGPQRILKAALVLLLLISAPLVATIGLPVAMAATLGSATPVPPAAGVPPPVASDGWTVPVAGYTITDSFGPRDAPCAYCSTVHWGMDLASGCGEPIFAASSGTVSKVGEEGTYGFRIMIDHPGGFQSLYAHLTRGSATVAPGDPVAVGDVIAKEGTTGQSTGCHLHFETRVDGQRINPIPFFLERGLTL
ncbi:M23 family metallopeptidase [Cryobacterium melibiosiphilum]|uniref:M23 family metallopeptidase n=1 Tax=Cryobacterium melibiosiphilum TaxID=995039 RepID=A0A3A5MSU9_9MICO|nr:M23 family metallopeptidase [Cryobacterium melibiosiphilum]RJT90198.1 M23 family metallopeptidase [Cryobacterium melibiosiphilum]